MKNYHPGTVYKINGIVVRAKKSFSCNGCIFDNLFGCPRIKDCRNLDDKESIRCIESEIIFVKP
jgi:hypothetical protein